GVLAVLPPAAHDVDAAVERGNHWRDIARIVLEVAVRRDDDPAARVIESGGKGCGLAEVAAEPYHPQMRIDGLQPRQDLEALIRTAVVDDDDFVERAPGAERRGE